MRSHLNAALIALTILAAPAVRADDMLRLAALNPSDLTAGAGAARQLDLGTLDIAPPPSAQTLQVTYDIHVGGFRLATIELLAIVDKGKYVAGTLLSTKGLADAFVSSNIQAVSTGDVNGQQVVPRTYNSDLQSSEKRQLLGLMFGKDGMPSLIDSNPPYDLERFPVTDEQKRNTIDPLAAALFIALGSSADQQEKCGKVVPIFDGKRRYNLALSYIKDDTVSLGKAYNDGKSVPALMCRAIYSRVAGFKPSKKKNPPKVPPIDMWLAPFPGTDFKVPVRMQATSDFGGIVARAVKLKVVPPSNKT